MKAIAYYRVSTQKQGLSGLGLEAQECAVEQFCIQRSFQLIGAFTEIESGKRDQRPQLQAALALARQTGATLLVAKLDRLSRNVAFLSTLMESKVSFTAVDLPEADEFTVHILAAVAQRERQLVSQRTKAALQAAKARGVVLGNPNGAAALRRAHRASRGGPDARRRNSQAFAEKLRPMLEAMRGKTLVEVAAALNCAEVATPKGGRWYASSVRNVRNRLGC